MSKRILGPFNRVEGDLEVKIDVQEGAVKDAWVTSPMYRGFEQILHGKHPQDALVYTPRICGICSVSQSVATAAALAQLTRVETPRNGELAINLIHATENLADHFTHFSLFFMPDFARDIYGENPWHADVTARFKAIKGVASKDVMKARADLMHIMGILAGKWPHTLGIQPGGSSRPVEAQEKVRLLSIIDEFKGYLEQKLFGDRIENILALQNETELKQWADKTDPNRSDFSRFIHLSEALNLCALGSSQDNFMSYGVYPSEGTSLFKPGVRHGKQTGKLSLDAITEDISHSWLGGQTVPSHPFQGVTLPDADPESGYTWCKAPRLDGEVVEVGALARQLIDGQPLVNDLVSRTGSNVQNRVIARLIEIPRLVMALENWSRELKPKELFCNQKMFPKEAEGHGVTEAARGSLGHWVRIKNGRILNYQIIAPTTWNFSPRDAQGVLGPLEQALIGTTINEAEKDPVAIQHIVRSFDPCMVCTVH